MIFTNLYLNILFNLCNQWLKKQLFTRPKPIFIILSLFSQTAYSQYYNIKRCRDSHIERNRDCYIERSRDAFK